ncbi:MAG: UDP-3-O-acyl-N-acetylglucosamine deacetylase, partial [Candidatus Rokuibacteriota bacterium]
RFPDEFVRHKVLDLVGDLFLLGRPLRAHVVGRNAGHALNYQLATAIQKAVAADRRRVAARAVRPAVPAPVRAGGEGFLPGVAAL